MPYIPKADRKILDDKIVLLKGEISLKGEFCNLGELNYVITRLVLSMKPKSYSDYNALIGVLECVKLELYRRAVAPYEDKKKEENGDVYGG